MRLWRRAFAKLKDKNSIFIASLGKRSTFRNPDIETAVIKATSHDEFFFDSRNVERIYSSICLSSANLKPLLWAITARMEKTRSWVVALKGLMLMHGILACKSPAVKRVGRFPFDLSNFRDGHSKSGKIWSHNAFIRSYYTFLDQKSALLYMNMYDRRCACRDGTEENNPVMQELLLLQKLQGLLDMLLHIRPLSDAAMVSLILDAMDCVILEIFDTYSRICSGVAKVLVRIYSAGKVEAATALRIVQKAAIQGEEVSLYFEVCRELGMMSASECPKVEQIPEEDILELEHIINGASGKAKDSEYVPRRQESKAIVLRESCPTDPGVADHPLGPTTSHGQTVNEAKALVVREPCQDSRNELRTIITHDWETFDDDLKVKTGENFSVVNGRGRKEDLPDLISFL